MWRDDFFPYYGYNAVWNAVAMVPSTVVVATGVELLFFSLGATLPGMGLASTANRLLRKGLSTAGGLGFWVLFR